MKYSLILSDPPWQFNARIPHKERADGTKKTRFGEGAEGHYPTMQDQEILALGPLVEAVADKNCVLCLWVTGSRLDFGIETLKAWGFRYGTIGWVWVKVTLIAEKIFTRMLKAIGGKWLGKKAPPSWRDFLDHMTDTGPGHYTASNVELLLIGVKGSVPIANPMRRQVIFDRRREHSRKPDQTHARILETFGDVPRLEMFCRNPVEGWECTGNQLDEAEDIRDALKRLAAKE
jgi:N6-adenosine-specific RNA methylase IME4